MAGIFGGSKLSAGGGGFPGIARPTNVLGTRSGGGLPSFKSAPGRAPPQIGAPQISGGQMQAQGGASANFQMPPAQQYQRAQADPRLTGDLNKMSQYGQGMMDPQSDYYQRLSQGMQQQIGGQAAAQQRASALRGAWSGMGAGASPEQMMTSADIGQAGLEAQGQAEAGLRLQAPQIGAGMMQSTFQPRLGQNQMLEQSGQFGAGLGESGRQFGANVGLQQQQMANQMSQFQAGLTQQADMFNAQAQQQQQARQWQAMMNQMAGAYGG